MQLDTNQIKEVDDDDFCLPTGNVSNLINIPPKWWNQPEIQEDRMAFGISHGINGTGAAQIVSVGHKLQEIMHNEFAGDKMELFSSQQFAGCGNKEFLIAQQENIIENVKSEQE
ncbi:MAG: hypothetical protein EZS28_029270 [Streblomastix strix]|uniref:Uncharacterized protein n=1 Tax=Streblomastix strix TaxID=222440 RepID=A0A5J4UZM2_9EUKA|nr:MAG: hypothetical protein EZS28_029270 [Streblomastix strix]